MIAHLLHIGPAELEALPRTRFLQAVAWAERHVAAQAQAQTAGGE